MINTRKGVFFMFEAYDKIFNALLNDGYTEQEAESLICQVIQDQKEMDDIANNIHKNLETNIIIN